MIRFLALLHARNLEFFRDRSSLAWNIIFPVLLVVAFAVAFSGGPRASYKVGVLAGTQGQWQAFHKVKYIQWINYSSLQKAQTKLGHHQLDLVLGDDHQYWMNPQSDTSYLAERLLLGSAADNTFTRHVERGETVRYVDWVVPGVIGMNIMFSALFGVGYVIVRYRKMGVLKRLQATPASAFEFLLAQLVSRLFISVMMAAIVFIGCNWALNFVILGNPLWLLVMTVAGTAAMTALGALVAACVESEEVANGILNLFTWPMLMLSEVWFSLEGAPHWLQQLASYLPLTHMVVANRKVMLEGAGWAVIWPHLLSLFIFFVIALSLAAWRFRWQRR